MRDITIFITGVVQFFVGLLIITKILSIEAIAWLWVIEGGIMLVIVLLAFSMMIFTTDTDDEL